MQSCEMSGIWEIYLCKNLETWGKFFENNKKMAKKWLKLWVKFWAQISICVKIYISQL